MRAHARESREKDLQLKNNAFGPVQARARKKGPSLKNNTAFFRNLRWEERKKILLFPLTGLITQSHLAGPSVWEFPPSSTLPDIAFIALPVPPSAFPVALS
jgi:hypothetical protein